MASCRKDQITPMGLKKIETHTNSDRFNEILFLNDSIGFVVGGSRFFNATILRTVDGGKSWNHISFPDADKGVYGITKTASSELFAICFAGIVLHSSTAGADWQIQHLGFDNYKDIACINDNRFLLIGGISFIEGYMQYIDAQGNTTKKDSFPHEFNAIEMVNGRVGYMCGYGVVYKTIDSTKTWKLLDVKNDNFKAIHVSANNELWTCGYNGSIFHSADGGNHWEKMRNGNDATKPKYRLLDILFTDPLHGYAVGENGLVITTDDGGKHWMEYKKFTTAHLRNIYAKKDGTLFICGDEGTLFTMQATR